MREFFGKVCSDFDAELVEVDGEGDHVHLLVNYPPKIAVSALVNSLKGVSSRLLRKRYSDLEEFYWKGGLWSPSYFAASCGGAPIEIIRHYIEQTTTVSSTRFFKPGSSRNNLASFCSSMKR
jgi:putative transposase